MHRWTRDSSTLAILVCTFAVGIEATHAEIDPSIRTYAAAYQVEYKGRVVGRSEISVRYDDMGRYRFESTSQFRGFLRFLLPNPLVERSEFASEAGVVTPYSFSHEDGSRRGSDNYDIAFDWSDGIATITTSDGVNAHSIMPGTLDPGAMQVQVMLDMSQSSPLGSFTLAHENGLRIYDYLANDDEIIEVPLGEFSTNVFVQEREGSSRQTFLWAAPELHMLPVRIEQKRNGESRAVLQLESVEWLGEPIE
ncbi:MAG: DUF3108 domain-containing protein [Candidatus Rariloculaceae bacterium]